MKLTNSQGHYLNIFHNLISLKSLGNTEIVGTIYAFQQQNWKKQERQCTYKVILRRVRATIVAMEKQ